MMHQDIVHP